MRFTLLSYPLEISQLVVLPRFLNYNPHCQVMDGMGDTVAEFKQVSERATEESFALGVSKWRLLPAAVGVSHLKLLQVSFDL